MGQTHVQAYTRPLLDKIVAGKIAPSFVITHPIGLDEASAMYEKFRDRKDGAIEFFIPPNG